MLFFRVFSGCCCASASLALLVRAFEIIGLNPGITHTTWSGRGLCFSPLSYKDRGVCLGYIFFCLSLSPSFQSLHTVYCQIRRNTFHLQKKFFFFTCWFNYLALNILKIPNKNLACTLRWKFSTNKLIFSFSQRLNYHLNKICKVMVMVHCKNSILSSNFCLWLSSKKKNCQCIIIVPLSNKAPFIKGLEFVTPGLIND